MNKMWKSYFDTSRTYRGIVEDESFGPCFLKVERAHVFVKLLHSSSLLVFGLQKCPRLECWGVLFGVCEFIIIIIIIILTCVKGKYMF